MKLNVRITLILAIISMMTICLLTSLMHFRYHVTRLNLVNEYLNVTIDGLTRTIDNSLKLGIKLENLKNVNELIQRAKKQEKIIERIDVLTIDNNKLTTLFKTNSNKIEDNILFKAMQKIKGTKGINWNFTFENGMSYVGLTLRNPAGLDHSAIVVTYKTSHITMQEHDEIVSLYKRMSIALIFSILMSCLISFRRTKTLTTMVNVLHDSLNGLEKGQVEFDLSGVHDPIVRGNFRFMLTAMLKARLKLIGIETLLTAAEKEQKSGKNK